MLQSSHFELRLPYLLLFRTSSLAFLLPPATYTLLSQHPVLATSCQLITLRTLATPLLSEDAHDHIHSIHMPGGPGNSTSAESAHPRRAAARKASRLAAEQLESSPIPSDAENDEAVSFGEPSTPKGGVRFTYGGKRKYKQSDRKSTRLNSSHSGESRMPSSA